MLRFIPEKIYFLWLKGVLTSSHLRNHVHFVESTSYPSVPGRFFPPPISHFPLHVSIPFSVSPYQFRLSTSVCLVFFVCKCWYRFRSLFIWFSFFSFLEWLHLLISCLFLFENVDALDAKEQNAPPLSLHHLSGRLSGVCKDSRVCLSLLFSARADMDWRRCCTTTRHMSVVRIAIVTSLTWHGSTCPPPLPLYLVNHELDSVKNVS